MEKFILMEEESGYINLVDVMFRDSFVNMNLSKIGLNG